MEDNVKCRIKKEKKLKRLEYLAAKKYSIQY